MGVQRGKGNSGGNKSRRMENKNSKPSKQASTVMFVPWTSKGKLVGKLKAEEERVSELTGFKVKFQEEGGTPLWLMFSTNLVEGISCGRKKGKTCRQDDERKVDCFARSVVYDSSCDICHPPGRKRRMSLPEGWTRRQGDLHRGDQEIFV